MAMASSSKTSQLLLHNLANAVYNPPSLKYHPYHTYVSRYFKDVFAVFDRNNDNSISASEILDVFKSLGQEVTEEQLQDILSEYDIDNSGSIDFQEFLLMMCSKMKASVDQENEARCAFKLFDSDGNGKIDVDELHKAMVQLGETITREEAQNMLNEADLDGDGFIDEEEFFKMMSTF